MLEYSSAADFMLDTKFRNVLNSQREKTGRSTSVISSTGLLGLTGEKNLEDLLRTSENHKEEN